MSYLNALRLHFAGRFQANVSTVNNDPAHFDNAIFKPSYQKMQGPGMVPPNGWFNPQGDAAWRLLGCSVSSAWTPAGAVTAGDPVLGYILADSDTLAPAKLVDLDSEQQMVSEIWGLQVRIADAAGNTLLRADYDPAAFMDIWARASASSGGDNVAGAMYQSVLRNLQWADVSASPFLTALKAAASEGMLSIKFNVDGFNLDYTSPDFMTGRIVGTIGPASTSEPHQVVIGRQFMAKAAPSNSFFIPQGKINFCAGVLDAAANCLYLDLGNALPSTTAGGAMQNLGDLTLSACNPIALPGFPAGSTTVLGTIAATGASGYATDADWYARTAGVVVLPLTTAQVQAAAASQLLLTGAAGAMISEWSNGMWVRADRFVYRMSPGDSAQIAVYATQFGRPLVGQSIAFTLDPSQLQPGSGFPYVAPSPPVATPTSALTFNATGSTDNDGRALLTLNVSDPGTPRNFGANGEDYGIDGQVYGIRPAFADATFNVGPVNELNFISLLLWSGFTPANPITWTDLQPIFQQYANLYPVMNRFLNLADYDSVVANAHLLLLAFGLDPANPNAMPVTRDLSPAKRNAILAWLKNPLPGAVAPSTRKVAPAAAEALSAGPPPMQGGKVAARARRLVLQSQGESR